jgi:hypothetical protein
MKKVWMLWMGVALLWLHAGLTDDAYRAYKKGEQSRAFDLYNRAWRKERSVKALYSIAVFYEKGIGVRKNRAKALENYRRVYDHIEANARRTSICRDPLLPYYRKTLKKLTAMEGKGEYRSTLELLNETCGAKAEKRGGICTADGKIASRYRDLAGCIDCAIVRNYPKITKSFFTLAERRENHRKRYRQNGSEKERRQIIRINRKIKRLVIPVMKELKRRQIACVRKAKTGMDLENCGMGYFHCANAMTGCELSVAECPEDSRISECVRVWKRRKHLLTDREREEEIRQIRESMERGDYFYADCTPL